MDRRCLYSISLLILSCGTRKPPDCFPFPDIALTNWLAPSLASPPKAERPTVLAMVGTNARPSVRTEDNKLPPTCFLMLVLANLISIPFINRLFFSNLFTTVDGTYKVSFP